MNKRIFLASLLIGLTLTVVCLFLYKTAHKRPAPVFPAELPIFELTTLDGAPFHSDSLSAAFLNAHRILLVFYSPGCLFCEHEGKELARYAADFIDTLLLFITTAPIDSAIAYTHRSGIGMIPQYYSLVDPAYKTVPLFGLRTNPTTLLYDKDQRLIQGFEGEVNAVKLLKTIREYEATKE